MNAEHRAARIATLYRALRVVEEQIQLGEQWADHSQCGPIAYRFAVKHIERYRQRRVSIIRRLQLRGENVE